MAVLSSEVEAYYMNALPFSQRPAAIELYNHHLLRSVLLVRRGHVPEGLADNHALNDEQWRAVCDAVIVTKLTQLTLPTQLTPECAGYLKVLLLDALGLSDQSLDEVYAHVYRDAPALGKWIQRLQKRLAKL